MDAISVVPHETVDIIESNGRISAINMDAGLGAEGAVWHLSLGSTCRTGAGGNVGVVWKLTDWSAEAGVKCRYD